MELVVSEDNQHRLRLGLRLDEILIPYRKCTDLDFSVPEEMGGAQVNDDVIKVEDFGGGQAQWREQRYLPEHSAVR